MSELMCVNDLIAYDGFQKDKAYFLSYLKVKGRKDTTIRTYDEALKSIYRTLKDSDMNQNPRCMSEDDIIQLKECLRISETSKKLYLIVFGRFLEVLGLENLVKSADILWNKTEPRRLFITPEDFRMMSLGCDVREKLVMMLGAYMGLRRSEICNIRLSDIAGNILTVHGKGHGVEGKVVHLRIPRPVMAMIDSYMLERKDALCDNLILRESGDGRGLGLTSGALGAMIRRIAKRNNVDMTPHSLRRLYATTLYDVGTDLNTIRQLMRHNSITTTVECYINVNPVQKEKAVDALCAVLGGLN